MYVYIYIYIHIYTHMCIYIYIYQVLCGHLEWELLESGRIISRRHCTEQQVLLRVMCLCAIFRGNSDQSFLASMDFSGVPRCVIPNIYLLPWFETPLRSKAPLKCTMSMVSVLVKDLRVARKRGSNRALTFKRRQILRRAASVLTKGALAKSKAQPAKKSKNAKPAPMIYEKWPVFRPFDVFSALVSAGMVSELCHVCNCK